MQKHRRKSEKQTDGLRSKFIEAAREAGADMSKDEFARVIGGLAKPKSDAKQGPKTEGQDDA